MHMESTGSDYNLLYSSLSLTNNYTRNGHMAINPKSTKLNIALKMTAEDGNGYDSFRK